MGPQRQLIAFGFLGADAEDADPWILVAQNLARIDAAHHRVMREICRRTFEVCSAVEEDKFIIRRRNNGGNTSTIHARNASKFERSSRKNSPGIARRNDR